MVKVCRGVYINPLTIVFFIVCYMGGKTGYFLISYISMIIHELAHLAAACFIGLKPLRVSLHPFGVNLKLKSNIVCSVSESIILYLSGPCLNMFLALLFITLFKGRGLWGYGFAVNIMLCFVNLLPVYPLDGGSIAKRVLSNFFSELVVNRMMKVISAILSLTVLGFGIYFVRLTEFNYSVVFISALLFANIFTVSEKYSETAVRNLVFQKQISVNKDGKPVRLYVSDGEFVAGNYIKYVRPGVVTCVAVLGEGGEVKRIVSEKEILKMI